MIPPQHARVLVVDDDFAMRRFLAKWIESMEYQVLSVDSAAAALEQLEEFSPHAILTDWEIPHQDGVELCRSVRAQDFPVFCMIMTGRTTRQELMSALDAGVDDFVRKPIDKIELLTRLHYGVQRLLKTDTCPDLKSPLA